jgi:DNA-binding GntR family transcriptional regulator
MTEGFAFVADDREQRRQQLPEEVAAYVRELILSGTVRPGEFLRMERIAQAVGVSNTPVREGMLALRSEGFVRLEPRRGFVVAPFTRQDVRDLFWAQAQLASELAARASKKITPEQLRRLEVIDENFDQAVIERDFERIAELGRSFHREINIAADSYRLALLLGSVAHHLPNRLYATIEEQVTATRDRHPQIVAALRTRASRKARSLMEQHILEGADHLLKILEQRGLWDTEQLPVPEIRPTRGSA